MILLDNLLTPPPKMLVAQFDYLSFYVAPA